MFLRIWVIISLLIEIDAFTSFRPYKGDNFTDFRNPAIQLCDGYYQVPLNLSGNIQLQSWLVNRSGFSFDLKYDYDDYIKHKDVVSTFNFTMTSKNGTSTVGLIFDGRMLMLHNVFQNVPLAFISGGHVRFNVDKGGHIKGYLKGFGAFDFPSNVIVHKDRFNETLDILHVSLRWTHLSTPFNLVIPRNEVTIGRTFEFTPQTITTEVTKIATALTCRECSTLNIWFIVLIVIASNILTAVVVACFVSRRFQRRPIFESAPATAMYSNATYRRMSSEAPPPSSTWYDSQIADC